MTATLTARPVAIDGVCNARDLGGYRVKQGTIRSGRLLRGADLAALTPQGQYQLAQIPVKKVIDLRTAGEVAELPNRQPEGATIIHLDVLKAVMKEHSASPQDMVKQLAGRAPGTILCDIYHAFVAEPSCQQAWRCFFQELLAWHEGAIYFHCTAGKDRTGFAAALVLLALGADRELIVTDYLLSNRYREEENQRQLSRFQAAAPEIRPEDIMALLQVQAEYLQTSFKAMDELYGGPEAFLTQILGIGEAERERLCALLVE